MPEENPVVENFAIVVDWSDAAGVPITHVNQFVAQPGPPTLEGGPDGIYLLLGSIPPPLIPRDTEGQRRAIETLKATGLKVDIHGRFHMSRARLEELIQVLQTTADTYDAAVERMAQDRSETEEG
ncbi:hypothetical protein OHB01_26765 [Microbispora hainanensis]|uniref:hypothetical protein n=1 Tax=Microbispora TaxID=2005 RepID=UPI00115A0FD2|nr:MULTISPECIES: hypothetical protein [Microbispora]NJP25271.1 hypothetical protein [Microbispora sp. CL1-1]TQS13720.1 hypothetical protein FLW53_13920 [Microbispora sp. SCL1-1]